jgi:formylglycine-generating enzyme required for sulfatase activity
VLCVWHCLVHRSILLFSELSLRYRLSSYEKVMVTVEQLRALLAVWQSLKPDRGDLESLRDVMLELVPATEEPAGQPSQSAPAEETRFRPTDLNPDMAAADEPVWRRIGIEMVTIPAGEFLYGEKKKRVRLPEYAMAKTPVTNAQYKAFVDATGHGTPEHWKKGRSPEGKEDHPMVVVSWEDAAAFCQWAGCRLPTEMEWEKGARGVDGREYPWGNEWELGRCNTRESGIGDTTPVGRYPNGASPNGLLDMAGNVWEWCGSDRNWVLRGGSWYDNSGRARCANRYRNYPVIRLGITGFRCVLSPTSSP